MANALWILVAYCMASLSVGIMCRVIERAVFAGESHDYGWMRPMRFAFSAVALLVITLTVILFAMSQVK